MPPQRAEMAVICRDLTKSFKTGDSDVPALRGIDLEVRCGELMMLVGPSGCGKTTLVSIIASILRADSGYCEVLGVDYGAISEKESIRFRGENIGFIFQAFNLLPVLTVEMNIAIPLIINGATEARALLAAEQVLEEVGLGDRRDAFPSELSGGQQQRVAIARAIVHRPKLLVCDEPTSALDHTTGAMVMNILRRTTRARGTTAIIVTHDNRIFDYADRIAHMEDGSIVGVVDDIPPHTPFGKERAEEI